MVPKEKKSISEKSAETELRHRLAEAEKRIDAFHQSAMELAMGVSDCLRVLSEVQRGNLTARVSDETLQSSEELVSNLGEALNEAIAQIEADFETIQRQQTTIQELSTPILKVWGSVLALPVIGVVDSMRSAEIMERLLAEISEQQARFVILDITGVEVVDSRTADHFIRMVRAAELLGTVCILTGIRPAVAQTFVELGVDLTSITTLKNLQAGLEYCRELLQEQPWPHGESDFGIARSVRR